MQQTDGKAAQARAIRPELLALRRRMLGLSQVDLAEATCISQGTLSKLEQGIKDASKEQIEALSKGLRCPTSFFYQAEREYGPPMSAHGMFRKKLTVGSKVLDRAIAELNVRIAHLRVLLRTIDLEPELPLPQYSAEDFAGGASDVAANVRKAWYAPRGPLKSLTEYIERAGCLVVGCDLSEAQIDGVSYRIPGLPPIIFLNISQPADRQRFTLAHELGHLVMHAYPVPEMEEEANEFASELLMPRGDIAVDLKGLTLVKAAQLKPYWRTSMGALMMRAKTLGAISDQESERLWKQYSFKRYRLREPAHLDFSAETQSLFPELLRHQVEDLGYSPDDLSRAMHLHYEELASMYGLPATEKPRTLRRVI